MTHTQLHDTNTLPPDDTNTLPPVHDTRTAARHKHITTTS